MHRIPHQGVRWTRRRFLQGIGTAVGLSLLSHPLSRANATQTILRLGYIPLYPLLQYFVARELGWYQKLGIQLEETRFSSGPPIVQAFAAGKLDLAYIGIAPAIVAIARGIPAKVVAANVKEPNVILASKEFATLWEKEGREAFSHFQARHGRRVRIITLPKGSTPDLLLRYWIIEKLRLDIDDVVEIVPVGAPQVLQALVAGQIDGASLVEPDPTIVAARKLPFRPIAYAREILPGQPGAVVLVTQRLIDKQPSLVRDLVSMHMRATLFIREKPERAAALASRVIGPEVLSVEIARQAMRSLASCFISDPHAIEAGTLVYNDFQNRLEIVHRRLTPAEIFDYRFYDRLARENPAQAVGTC